MSKHKSVRHPKSFKFHVGITRLFVEHRAFSMHHLIMG